jgi:uncharacterized membrane protein YphA (DoxX/SURF4 family)
VTLARWTLAAVFLTAAMSKLPDQRRFTFVVLAYRVLPRHLAQLYATALPWTEAVVGMMLLLGVGTRIGAALSGVLLLSFTTAMALNVARGRTNMDCGCLGVRHRQKIGSKVLVRNIVLLLLCVEVVLFAGTYLALDGQLSAAVAHGWPTLAIPAFLIAVVVSTVLLLGLPFVRHAMRHATVLRGSR